MYLCFITPPLILIKSPGAFFNSPIDSFCLLDRALVLTSDNFHSFSLHSRHTGPWNWTDNLDNIASCAIWL